MELPAADTAACLNGIAARQERVLAAQARLERELAAARADIAAGGLSDSLTATALILAADALLSAAASPGRLTGGVLASVLGLIPAARAPGRAALSVVPG
jgi:hypothetical protein